MRERRKIDPFSALMEIAQVQQDYFTTRQAIAAHLSADTSVASETGVRPVNQDS